MKSLIKFRSLQIALLAVLLICILIFLRSNSTETIPYEKPESQRKLNYAITVSKLNIDSGIKELESLNDLGEYTNYKKNYILARLYEKKKDFNSAISIYENLSNRNYPLKERVIFHLADLNTETGNDKKALVLLKQLIYDFPSSRSIPQTKYVLAQTQLRLKLTGDAIKTLLSLRSEFPKTQFGIATNYYLGEYEFNKGNYNEALKYWRQYLELSPDGRFASEIVNWLNSTKNISLLPYDYSLLGDVFFHKKDYKQASYYYKIENNIKKYYKLGYSFFRINNKTEAFHYLRDFAQKFPKSKNARWALYYAGESTPYYLRKAFWEKATKDIPELAYYTIYKEAQIEKSPFRKEKLLKDYISHYPNGDFTLDAVWEIMWQHILDKNYLGADEIGKKYFNFTNNDKSETRAKIGFWLGKIAEITNQKNKAVEYYNKTKDVLFDNYYSFRAKDRLLALSGQKDNFWQEHKNINNFKNFNWSIPNIVKIDTIKNYFGATTFELINLEQYDEAIDLIGKSKFPSKRINAWFKALNGEYEISINLANSISNNYNLNSNSTLWELAYPLYYWQYIINTCKNYPNIDPMLICGVIRQESRFDASALSTSDAYGLMQLIPPTAKSISKQIMINLNSLDLLKEPEVNIALGVHYLDGLIKDLNNPLFAVASYNAGSSAVKKWISNFNTKHKDLDFFVEEIPYAQTKDYVKKVFSSYWTYLKLYQ